MDKQGLFVQSYFLATREKTLGRFLSTGKVLLDTLPDSFFFYLIEITPETKSAPDVESIITETLSSFSHIDSVNESSFEKVLNKINAKLANFAECGHDDWFGKLNAIVGVVDGDNIFLSQSGKVIGYIFRKNRISSLTDSNKGNAYLQTIFDDITVGKIAQSDRLVFGTSEFFARVSLDRTRRLGVDRSLLEDLLTIQKHFQRLKSVTVNAIFFEIDCIPDDNPTQTLYIDEPEITSLDVAWSKTKPVLATIGNNIGVFAKFAYEKIVHGSKSTYSFTKKTISPELTKYTSKITSSLKKQLEEADRNNYFKSRGENNPTGIRIRGGSYVPTGKKRNNSLKTIAAYFSIFGLLFKKQNRKYLYITLIALAIIIGFTKIAINSSNRSEVTKVASQELSYDKATELLTTGKQDIALGKSEGKDKLYQALEQANIAKENESYRDKSISLIREIEQALDKLIVASRIYSSDASIQLPENTVATQSVGNNIYSVSSDKKIYSGSYNSYESKFVASLPEYAGDIVDSFYSSYLNKIFFYTRENKIFSLDTTSDTIVETIVSEAPGLWENAASFALYKSSIYLLDSAANKSYKHLAGSLGYQKGAAYLYTSKKSLETSIDLAIDGNVYVLFKDGSVTKYTKSTPDLEYKLSEIPAPKSSITGAKKIYTDEDTNSLFVLDTTEKRVIQFDKSGKFEKQYIFDGDNLTDFIVNPKLQKMWLLANNKLYQVGL